MCEVTVVCVTLGASKVETCTRSVEKSEIKQYREHLSKGTRSCKLMALTCNSTDALIVYLKPKKYQTYECTNKTSRKTFIRKETIGDRKLSYIKG